MSLSLQQTENYCESLQATEHECFRQYARIIKEFWMEFAEKIVFQDERRKRYTLLKGVETIAHIFLISLMYSNNLDMSVESAQKGQMCFLEFISQMGEDSSVLNIGLVDAIMFTYRKTIFDIPVEIKKDFAECDFLIPYVKLYIDIHNTALSGVISPGGDYQSKPATRLTDAFDSFELSVESLLQLPLLCPHLNVILLVAGRLNAMLPPITYLCALAQFLKLIQRQGAKNVISVSSMEKKLLVAEASEVRAMNSGKIAKWLIQPDQ
jgi:hypothetical protein